MNRCYFAINLTKFKWPHSAAAYLLDYQNWKEEHQQMRAQDLLLPLKAVGVAFGPFEKEEQAETMAASSLNDDNRDFFGDMWCIILANGSEATEYIRPKVVGSRLYVCSNSECEGVQRFKGSCSNCKSKGIELVPTVLIRDWEGRLEGRL
jgi:hypothetical protein